MKKFRITVNGKAYEVEVEDLGGSSVISAPVQKTVQTAPLQPKPAAKSVQSAPKAEQKKTEAPKAVPQGAETVEAPMPGTILDIKVNQGDAVEAGQVLLILEAMKMENEIVAPRAGKIAVINTSNGASVNAGDALVSLE